MAKRHFLQQSHKYSSKKHKIGGAILSEKFDGQRCYWDGGISRGLLKSDVPWANTAKDSRYVIPPVATGLWSRYGNVIHAPAWFLDSLPPFPLDGELWTGRGKHQECRKIISKLVPNDKEWKRVRYIVFDSPHYENIFYDSIIDIPNYYKRLQGCLPWINKRCNELGVKSLVHAEELYEDTVENLCYHLPTAGNPDRVAKPVVCALQINLPYNVAEAQSEYNFHLNSTMRVGGEGVVTRSRTGIYLPERVHHCVKNKPYHDDEGIVRGYVTGRETDKGSKLLGLMGSMIVEWKGKTFQISGFTDEERTLRYIDDASEETYVAFQWACMNPETNCPNDMEAKYFPRGSVVTFRYRELSDDGIPKEASYMRKA